LGSLEKRLKNAKKDLERCRRKNISLQQVGREAALKFKVDRLEEQIDIYWKQRAHIDWLKKGDLNTSFFHAACSERRRRNQIGKLKKESGVRVEDEDEKKNHIKQYFEDIFKAGEGGGEITTRF
jgi:hypothetical protein